jgi:Phospholipase B
MDVYNADLLQYIRPDTILSWMRARLSNQLASTGAEWAEVFSMYHSGTCTSLLEGVYAFNDLLTIEWFAVSVSFP